MTERTNANEEMTLRLFRRGSDYVGVTVDGVAFGESYHMALSVPCENAARITLPEVMQTDAFKSEFGWRYREMFPEARRADAIPTVRTREEYEALKRRYHKGQIIIEGNPRKILG